MYNKYGKTLVDMLQIADIFSSDRELFINEEKRVNELYKAQPPRKRCKVCDNPIDKQELFFIHHEIGYKLCDNCGHLNGIYEDTIEFSNKIYIKDDYGKIGYYAQSETDFHNTVHVKYEPKAKFLIDSLSAADEDACDMKLLDIGAGCGYMVAAFKTQGINSNGIDLSPHEVEYGNRMLGEQLLRTVSLDAVYDEIENTDKDVISFINVLEHIHDIKRVFRALKSNKNVKYLFFEVPKFSFSTILEIVNQQYYSRQLTRDHTHLFTNDSLDWIYDRYNLTPIASWEFGSEVLDLRRYITFELENQGASDTLINDMLGYFKEHGDDIQLVIDRSRFASGVIVLARLSR